MPKSWHVLAFAWLFCAVPDFERTPGVAFLAASLICPRIVRMCNMCLNISVVHAPAYLANFSERIRERKLLHSSFFTLAPILLTTSRGNACRQVIGHPSKSWITILGNTGCFLFFRQAIKTCQETLFDWFIIQSLVWVTRQEFIVHSQSHSLDRQQLGQNF